jgi:uncharacterized membrane protein
MATLTVWMFPTADGAEDAEFTLKALQSERLITIQDAAVISWPESSKKPATHQLTSLKRAGALGGAFWGLLFGVLFFVPLIGMAVGAAVGAISGALGDIGIDDDFIASVRAKVTPGTSALFLLSSEEVLDRITAALVGTGAELISTSLSSDQEAALRQVFAD